MTHGHEVALCRARTGWTDIRQLEGRSSPRLPPIGTGEARFHGTLPGVKQILEQVTMDPDAEPATDLSKSYQFQETWKPEKQTVDDYRMSRARNSVTISGANVYRNTKNKPKQSGANMSPNAIVKSTPHSSAQTVGIDTLTPSETNEPPLVAIDGRKKRTRGSTVQRRATFKVFRSSASQCL